MVNLRGNGGESTRRFIQLLFIVCRRRLISSSLTLVRQAGDVHCLYECGGHARIPCLLDLPVSRGMSFALATSKCNVFINWLLKPDVSVAVNLTRAGDY